MALMVPDFISEDCRSPAERKLFDKFARELPDDFTVLHSLGVARHRYKLYAEADFVLIHPSAIIVFEVKGGRIARRDGAWYFTDRFGSMHRRRESPMQQAASVTAAIRNAVRHLFGQLSPQATVAYGSSTFFPDIEFAEVSPEWDLRRIYDAAAWHRPMREIVQDAVDYSRAEMQRTTSHAPTVLSADQLAKLKEYLRGDFEKVPSLASAVAGHEHEMVRLATPQYAIIDRTAKNLRMVIEGPAGSGKTLIALECARRHAEAGRRVLYVCYNKLLALHLQAYASRNKFTGSLSIGTLHGHCLSVLREAGVRIPAEVADRELFADEIPRKVAEALASLSGLRRWEVLVVDEGQDIASHAPFIRALEGLIEGGFGKGRWIWFEDPRQRIIRHGGSEPLDLSIFSPSFFTLTKNWRNTDQIATFTSVATTFPLPELSGIAGPTVRTFSGGAEERAKALDATVAALLRDGCRPEHIVLLTARAEQRASFADRTSIAGLKPVPFDPTLTAESGQIRFSSVYRFKGLEAKVIILADIDELSSVEARREAYVGMSRANSALYVVLSENARVDFENNRLTAADR